MTSTPEIVGLGAVAAALITLIGFLIRWLTNTLAEALKHNTEAINKNNVINERLREEIATSIQASAMRHESILDTFKGQSDLMLARLEQHDNAVADRHEKTLKELTDVLVRSLK